MGTQVARLSIRAGMTTLGSIFNRILENECNRPTFTEGAVMFKGAVGLPNWKPGFISPDRFLGEDKDQGLYLGMC